LPRLARLAHRIVRVTGPEKSFWQGGPGQK
jgi:hypothetical protein